MREWIEELSEYVNLSANYRGDMRNLFGSSAPKNETFFGGPSAFALANLQKLASSLHAALELKNFSESLSLYFADRFMENQEKISCPLTELSEEIHQAALETDFLLHASDQLQSAYSSLLGKMDHVGS